MCPSARAVDPNVVVGGVVLHDQLGRRDLVSAARLPLAHLQQLGVLQAAPSGRRHQPGCADDHHNTAYCRRRIILRVGVTALPSWFMYRVTPRVTVRR